MKNVLTFVCVLISVASMAQERPPEPPAVNDSLLKVPIIDDGEFIYFIDPEPEFPGGVKAMWEFIIENIHYPAQAIEDSIQGRVYLSFVVDSTGSLVDAKIDRGVHELLDNEALRLVSIMPKWIPAYWEGEPINMRVRLPINFVLDNGEEPEK